uniref:Uncharacterized protein n=1 Tax=Oryza glumipatula TaxID=40148 RepID=A0A0D9YCF0_9ORYZ
MVQDEAAAGGQRREKVEETAIPAMLSPLVPQSGTGTHHHSPRARSYDSHTMSQAPRQLEMRTSRTTPSRSDSSPVITAYGFRNPSTSSPGTVEASCQSPPMTDPNPYRSTPATTFTRGLPGSSITVDRTTAALPSPYTWSRSPPPFGLCGNRGRKKTGRSTPGPEYTITQSGPACAAHRNVPSVPAAVDAPSAWTASDDCHVSVSDWYSKRSGVLFTSSANRNLISRILGREKDGYLNWLDPGGSATSLRPKRRQEEVPRGPSGDGGRRRAACAERSTTTSSRRPLAAKRKELPDAARK